MSIVANFDPRRMDQTVTFQRDTGAQDASGDAPESWTTVVQCRAAVDGDKAKEAAIGGGIKSRLGYTVWVNADIVTRFSITQRDRISWNGKLLNIIDLPDQGLRGRFMPMICQSGVNAG